MSVERDDGVDALARFVIEEADPGEEADSRELVEGGFAFSE